MDAETGDRLENRPTGPHEAPRVAPIPPGAVRAIALRLGFDWKALRPLLATWLC